MFSTVKHPKAKKLFPHPSSWGEGAMANSQKFLEGAIFLDTCEHLFCHCKIIKPFHVADLFLYLV